MGNFLMILGVVLILPYLVNIAFAQKEENE